MRFYVNKSEQLTSEREVHRAGCAWLPDAGNRICLGYYTSRVTVREARRYDSRVDAHCRPESHTR